MTRSNHRPLSRITAEIERVERSAVFTCGKLLIEAKRQLHHGQWTKYLRDIEWHPRNAQLYMGVAKLAAKTKSISHLNAAPTALFQLVWISENHPECVALAIKRLKASIARKDSASKQREAVILTPRAKELPGKTDFALRGMLDAINSQCFGSEKRSEAMRAQARAIADANPQTEKELNAVKNSYPIPLPASERREGEEPITNLVLLVRGIKFLKADTFSLSGLEASDVAAAISNLETILKRLRTDNVVQLVADRAAARSHKVSDHC